MSVMVGVATSASRADSESSVMKSLRRRLWLNSVLVVGLLAMGLAAYLYFARPAERAYRVSITAGGGDEFMTTFLGQADHVSDLLARLTRYQAMSPT